MIRTLPIALACGAASSAIASPEPQPWPHALLKADLQHHTYFNPSTGEKIVTLLDEGARPADAGNGSPGVWISDNDLPCAAFGQTAGLVAIISQPTALSIPPGVIALDWGDIPPDTVVDCIGINYATAHLDTDLNGDTIGDGVTGVAVSWSFYDADNGFNDCLTRTGLISLTLFNLPGALTAPDPEQIATFTGTIDLGGTSSVVFEVGDSDSDLNGAAVHNANIFNTDIDGDTIVDSDRDGDGLYDFSYTVRFYQPGTIDTDGDTVIDGGPNAGAALGVRVALPDGTATAQDDAWSFAPDPLPSAQGVEDAWDAYCEFNAGLDLPMGTFFFGGFSCDPNGDGSADDMVDFAQFEMILYGYGIDGPPCSADLFPVSDPDSILNFFDLGRYLELFGANDAAADLFPTGSPDGVFNFFDLGEYLNLFGQGCP